MVVAISLGMTMALSGVGILAIRGRNHNERKFEENEEIHHRFATAARIAEAAFVLLIGRGLFSLALTPDRHPPSPATDSKRGME